jgi:ubiquinone/menaquinone biosynthesis C-methylase UbiE
MRDVSTSLDMTEHPRPALISFDTIAPHYRWLEAITFGNKLQAARISFIGQIGRPRRALILGEGNGRFLEALLQAHRDGVIDCVDSSVQMLQRAREHITHAANVRLLHEDLTVWTPEENAYDLIVTHFFLDCFTRDEIARIVDKLAGAATGNAIWLLADFSIPPAGLAKVHAQVWLKAMYRFFRLTTGISGSALIDPTEFLQLHGFHLAQRNLWRFGLIKSDLWQRM